ncbi:hypothetical protein [Pseudoxanthomonas sp.]|uniref:hypothetical protein n=1 Tax=Pseudoxanthomonas sp. TaxID=1871049 RepID=UPI0028C4A579|nr:hypothetical protein [Pseudoxanthomonas sp.]
MTIWLAILATVSGCAAALLLYLASPQQQWRAAGPWPSRHGWWPGTLLALVSLVAAMQVVAKMEAVFAWSVLLMFVWSIAPFIGAWRARSRAGGKS